MSYEGELISHYDDIHQKFFPPAQETSHSRRQGVEIAALQRCLTDSNNTNLFLQNQIDGLEKRLAHMERLFKPASTDPHCSQLKRITVDSILNVVCAGEGIKKTEIIGQQRYRDICDARHYVYYLATKLTFHSLPQIGRLLGNRDHTTILHGKRRMAKLLVKDRALHAKLTEYEGTLLASMRTIAA